MMFQKQILFFSNATKLSLAQKIGLVLLSIPLLILLLPFLLFAGFQLIRGFRRLRRQRPIETIQKNGIIIDVQGSNSKSNEPNRLMQA